MGRNLSDTRLRTLARGTAIAATAVLLTGSFLSPAQAAQPATPYTAAFPASPQAPSADDIGAAKGNEAATKAEADKIESLLDDATRNLAGTVTTSMRASGDYTSALVISQDKHAAADAAQIRADAAGQASAKAKVQMGQLAGDLYKNGGMTPSVQSMLSGAASADSLYQASTLMVLGENRSKTFQTAEFTASTANSLRDQAEAARKAADDATKAAEDAKTRAVAANDAQTAVVTDNARQRTALVEQLAALHNTTVALEDARVTVLETQKAEAKLAAIVAASSSQTAPIAPAAGTQAGSAVAAGTPNAGNSGAGNAGASKPAPPAAAIPAQPAPAPVPAPAPTPVPAPTPAPPVVAPPTGNGIAGMVNFAMNQIGKPYVYGGDGPNVFDCSGLVHRAFASVGINVARTGTPQFWNAPVRVPLSQMQYGDLLVFDEYPAGSGNFGHIAIYIGGGKVVQALSPEQGIQVTELSWMSGMSLYPYAARY